MVVESSLRKNDIGNVVYQKNYYIKYLDNCGQNKTSKSPMIWRFSSAHFYRKVISEKNNLWYNILEVINGIVGP